MEKLGIYCHLLLHRIEEIKETINVIMAKNGYHHIDTEYSNFEEDDNGEIIMHFAVKTLHGNILFCVNISLDDLDDDSKIEKEIITKLHNFEKMRQ